MSTAPNQSQNHELFRNEEMSENPYHGLSLPHLADIKDNVEQELALVKKRLSHVEAAIQLVVEDEVTRARRFHQKPNGAIHVVVEDCDVKHVLPKKVTWDQKKLASACDYIANLGYSVGDFGIKTELKIDEKAWDMLPVKIAEIVRDARSLSYGKPQIEITPTE